MFTLPVINVKTDPLDVLLATLGLRLQQLAKSKENESFNQLIKEKTITIQFRSPQMARYYRFEQGHFGQDLGETQAADLIIDFDNSLSGAKLLAKADVAALMSAIQDEQVKISGDYKLILWFAGVAKQGASIPEQYQPYVDKIKPYTKTAKGVLTNLKHKLGKS